jgi:hypothetical protein
VSGKKKRRPRSSILRDRVDTGRRDESVGERSGE